MARPSYLEINLAAIQSNLSVAKSHAPNSKVLGCVKANAYGHGAVEVAKAIESSVELLGLANLEEALSLRSSGISAPCLLLEGCFDNEEWITANQQSFACVIHSPEQLQDFLALELPQPMDIWLKLDSGMHRLGFDPDKYLQAHEQMKQSSNCRSIVLMSHFACSEELDNPFNDHQLKVFADATAAIDAPRSLANSAAILTRPDTHFDWIRPGYLLYGNSPMSGETPADRGLIAAMGLYSQVISIRNIDAGEGVGYNQAWHAEKPSTIAVVAIGYGDGYPRNAKNGSPVLIDGQPASTIGNIAMDMMHVDITALSNVTIGSKVELWGPNLPASQVAEHSGMSGYELFTRLTPRLPRRYLSE